MSEPHGIPKLSKACVRSIIEALLRLQGTRLPAYFSLRDKLSYLLHGLEPSLVKVATGILRPGDTVVDIGANVGFLTRTFASLVGKSGMVWAFEPDPTTFECLLYNTRTLPQVSAYQVAISDQIGDMTLYLHPTSGMSNSLVNAWRGSSNITVTTSTLDALMTRSISAPVRLIKIDVEGAELLVLYGMQETLRAPSSPQVIFEFCPNNLGSPKVETRIFDFFGELGYALYSIDSEGQIERVDEASMVHERLNKNHYANLLGRRE